MDRLFDKKLNNLPYQAVRQSVEKGQTPVALTGVGSVQKAFVSHALFCDTGKKIIYIAPDDSAAAEAYKNISAFFYGRAKLFPAREITLFSAEAQSRENEFARIETLYEFTNGKCDIVVTTPPAVLQFTADTALLKETSFSLKTGGVADIDETVSRLVSLGYTRSELVEGRGQFAKRGGILDVFTPSNSQPVRIEFWGDEIDCMGTFDVYTQRRIENIDEINILPSSEFVPTEEERALAVKKLTAMDRKYTKKNIDTSAIEEEIELLSTCRERSFEKYSALVKDKNFTLFDYADNCIICIADEDKTALTVKNYLSLLEEDIKSGIERGLLFAETCRFTIGKGEFYKAIEEKPTVLLDNFLHSYKNIKPKDIQAFVGKQLGTNDDIKLLCDDIFAYTDNGYEVYVAVKDEKRAPIMEQMLEERGAKAKVCVLDVTGGMEITDMRFALLCDRKSRTKVKKRRKLPEGTERIKSYNDLVPGDYIVHINHGIGKYLGIEKLVVGGITKDYIKLKYSDTDVLYIPTNQLDLISKYVSGDTDTKVKLSKLGGTDWARTKARVKRAVADMADELLELYAARQSVKGYAFTPDSEWQKEFEERFEYEETEDQLHSVEEIKRDMESSVPMERLLCGDVGFGKTEVALRAVFKCVNDGKQAAILVPTTILAWQHFQTILARFSGIPVNVEVLSRYRTKSQQEEIIRKLKRGEIDVIVGTHRLIQKDIKFKDLGLVVVDEEQRFGVAHKERLKEISKNVDSLTLTATPIPRTLSMALSGIRDMSLIEEPPRDRQPVSTYVMEYDFTLLCEAMRQELRRGGQIFYLHNRVDSIELTAAKIAAQIPDANIRTAHGKMSEQELSEIWDSVISGETDILVCTTIIETGIDVSNANTLIVEDADRMGLAQLYQLRGRVGRSHRRAFCYLTYRKGRALSEDAEKRLSAIREFTEFGSGFKVAMRDLEIRGAGNILGAQQSGHLESVGYDLYVKLLDEAVRMKKGEVTAEKVECVFDIPLSAHIPFDYIESQAARIDIYKKIAVIDTPEELDDMQDELLDRFGELPKEVEALCRISFVRNMATNAGITEIKEEGGRIVIDAGSLDLEALSGAMEKFGRKIVYMPSPQPIVKIMPRNNLSVLDEAETFVIEYFKSKENKNAVKDEIL